jgi:hypothetical protein
LGGILLPLAMLAIDPAVFHGDGISEGPILGAFAPGCYFGMLVGMLALAIFLLARPRSALLSGTLAGAACFACLLGLVLLPFSLLGLLANGVGILGLSPFVTALVIGRQAKLAHVHCAASRSPYRFWLGAGLYVAGCLATQVALSPPLQLRS